LLLLPLLLRALCWLQQLKATVMVQHPAIHRILEALLPLLLLLVCASLPATAAAAGDANEEVQRGSGGHDVSRDPGKPRPLAAAASDVCYHGRWVLHRYHPCLQLQKQQQCLQDGLQDC
jgi:hypothetical protein